ncbi:MAG: hypothetical protein NUK65_05995 [Firmicutes bacterium]|nr:hypothetical protein [Bacillota bacterium]
METMSIVTLFLLALPEGILVSSVGLTLTGIRPNFSVAIRVGLVYMVCAFIMRRLFTEGSHILAIMIALIAIIMFFYRLNFKKAFAAAVVALIALALSEAIVLPIFTRIFSLTIADVLADPWLRIAASIPTQLCLFLIFFLGFRIRNYHKKSTYSSYIHK